MFPDEMYVELDVLRALVVDGAGGHVDCGDVVVEHHRHFLDATMELVEQDALDGRIRDDAVLGFGAGAGHCRLASPRNTQ